MKLITINIEKSKHLERIIPFLQREKPDVLCVQEIIQADVPFIQEALDIDGQMLPTTYHLQKGETEANPSQVEGVALFTNLRRTPIRGYYYSGDGTINTHLQGSNSKVVIHTQISDEFGTYNVATTKFKWTPDGKPSITQERHFKKLTQYLTGLTRYLPGHEDIILCGDFNVPRGGPMFKKFAELYKDNLPSDITSTLDPQLHSAAPLELVVDTIFTTPGYIVSNVRVVEGLSDHKAVIAKIIKN
jgi:exonuclease III